MGYGLIFIIKRGMIMTDFTDIKLKINEIINKNKKKYFNSKTIADIEEFELSRKQKRIEELDFFPSLLMSLLLGFISSIFIVSLFPMPSSHIPTLAGSSVLFLFPLGMYFTRKIGSYLVKKSVKKKINKIENGTLSKHKITEELFKDLFWTSSIDKETETVLKMILPYNLYLMLHSQRPSGLTYLDVSKFLEHIEKYEKEVKDIEDKRISMGMDIIKTSDIKNNVLVI